MRLRVGAATDIGRVRDINEDAFAVRVERGLFIVCDGMGGAAAGEVASRLAVDTVVEHLNRATDLDGAPAASDGYLPRTRRLADAVREANQRICDQAEEHPLQSGMGTTIVSAWVSEDIVSLAHVGDSRAYLWHGGRLEALTRDHSLVEAQVRAGLLDREKSLQSADQNILLRALGREPDVEVELSEAPVQRGDYLLLCSDGLTRMVPEPALAETLSRQRDPQRMCDDLIAVANLNGGADNITAVVVEVVGGWWRRLWNRWRRTA
jgi:protein phosphatase